MMKGRRKKLARLPDNPASNLTVRAFRSAKGTWNMQAERTYF